MKSRSLPRLRRPDFITLLGSPSPFCPFFFNATPPTEIYTLSLHDALPIWMLVVRRSLRDMRDHVADVQRVRARGVHQILRLADLGRGHHLQRARHLAGVRDALDLGADFSCACHLDSCRCRSAPARGSNAAPCAGRLQGRLLHHHDPVFLNSSSADLKVPSMSAFQSPLSTIFFIRSPWFDCMNWCKACSNGRICASGTSSR